MSMGRVVRKTIVITCSISSKGGIATRWNTDARSRRKSTHGCKFHKLRLSRHQKCMHLW